MKMINVTEIDLLGSIGFWAIYQSPKNKPMDLNIVIDKVKAVTNDTFNTIIDMKYKEFEDRAELYNWLDTTLKGIDEVNQWNLSEIELKNNVKFDDSDRGSFIFTSAYDTIKTEHNFIDIDALIQNITYMLVKLSQDN